MIEVLYAYRTKDGVWRSYSKQFTDKLKAFRFIQVIKHSTKMILQGWSATDYYDREWLERRV
ncbi:MAG: hypothetical protein J6S85_23055 [Methanobrevibacter sp.]|nr:hypothetical protein [Methanobrevibacter sp.]